MSEQVFRSVFSVSAGIEAVAAFHHNPRALRWLTPPPILVQFHRLDPLGEGAVVEFTMWFAFIPVRWQALHQDYDAARGFTDVQVSGPLAKWVHTHAFEPVDACTTRIKDTVIYQHAPGWRGWLSRMIFSNPGLTLLFVYRKLATRFMLRRQRDYNINE